MKLLERRLHLLGAFLVAFTVLGAGSARALPALQLGPGAGSWTYDVTTQTWVTTDNPLQLAATANATAADGGNGDYAWDTLGTSQLAYLVVSAVPKQDALGGDAFDITIANDGGVTLVDFGFGTPPPNDTNDLAPHGIFPTWYEVYEFSFDGGLTLISNTQPGQGGDTGQGYLELFDIDINSLADGVDGIHFDLFTASGANGWDPNAPDDNKLVEAFAPFSHDAETGNLVPEPRAALLFGVGGLIAGMTLRRRR